MLKKYTNGRYIELTAEEIANLQAEETKAQIMERTRPLTESEVSRLLIAQQINALTVDDNTALRMLEFYPEWSVGQAYPAGHKVQHGASCGAVSRRTRHKPAGSRQPQPPACGKKFARATPVHWPIPSHTAATWP